MSGATPPSNPAAPSARAATDPTTPLSSGALYTIRRAELAALLAGFERRSNRLSTLRGLTFVTASGIGGYAMFEPMPQLGWLAFAIATAAFMALVIAHALLIARKNEIEQRLELVTRGVARLTGDASASPEGARFEVADHAYSLDLDLFGPASIFQLVCVAQTAPGETTLAAWLSAPAAADTVHARQDAARELVRRHRFREDLAVLGVRAAEREFGATAAAQPRRAKNQKKEREKPTRPVADPSRAVLHDAAEGLLSWAEAPPVLDRRGVALVAAARVLVPLTLALILAAQVFGAERLGVLRHAWILPLLAQVGVLLALRPALDAALTTVASREAPFGKYRGMLARIEAEELSAAHLAELRRRIGGASGHDASRAMGALQKIIGYADLRHNGIVHFIANTFLLWDVWCGVALDRWRGASGRHARAWLEALGEVEALSSVATFAFEHPGFVWPDVAAGEPHFEALGLGHPRIPDATRVVNDVALDRPGKALLVTGSNMSGKSTLLRAIGVNTVLALAGAPVCAERLRLSILSVRTSMRIQDSLEHGVSHFYAELERLKGVVDKVNEDPSVLFLFDEILHGTNSRERILGARAILLHLIDRGAIGLASSHDLGLADLEEASGGRVTNVHLEELVVDGRMTFDFKLKPGVVTTANALRLMKLVGIAVNLPET